MIASAAFSWSWDTRDTIAGSQPIKRSTGTRSNRKGTGAAGAASRRPALPIDPLDLNLSRSYRSFTRAAMATTWASIRGTIHLSRSVFTSAISF